MSLFTPLCGVNWDSHSIPLLCTLDWVLCNDFFIFVRILNITSIVNLRSLFGIENWTIIWLIHPWYQFIGNFQVSYKWMETLLHTLYKDHIRYSNNYTIKLTVIKLRFHELYSSFSGHLCIEHRKYMSQKSTNITSTI